ncbi:hypothetical protein [Orrella marina]|uniref:hypothetical protein n=1 Tax=Orrella marina TaxID=2163011 RepID=UPI00131F315B|nr:hypothetical protein [Orrella marina]
MTMTAESGGTRSFSVPGTARPTCAHHLDGRGGETRIVGAATCQAQALSREISR